MAEKKKKISFKKIISYVAGGIVILALLFLSFQLGSCGKEKEPTISASYISGKLEQSSELTSAKLKYKGLIDYDDNGVTFINKGAFTMVYNATVRAGIDMKEVKTNVNESKKEITITIPKAKILEVKIDPNSIRYYDESFSLFKSDEKESANKAQTFAEKDAKKESTKSGILEMADQQSETLIKGILQGCVNGYKLKCVKAES